MLKSCILGLYAPLRIHPSAMQAKPCCKHGFLLVKFWNCQHHITCNFKICAPVYPAQFISTTTDWKSPHNGFIIYPTFIRVLPRYSISSTIYFLSEASPHNLIFLFNTLESVTTCTYTRTALFLSFDTTI